MLYVAVAGHNRRIETLPNECPQCHHAIDPRLNDGIVRHMEPFGRAVIELFLQCPHRDCLCAFIGRYAGQYDRGSNDHTFRLQSTAPYSPVPPQHSPEIDTISPQFVAVFKDAAAADAWHLNEISGCGYRKALEYLVKDYCASLMPERADEIRKRFLGQVISEFVPDAGIKACAQRAAWLGNDETHYVRKWTKHDLDDLKKLIALTESWITTAERTKAYLADMPDQ